MTALLRLNLTVRLLFSRQQNGNQEKGQSSQMMTGAIPRAPTRLPEDVTALAEREMGGRDRESKNAVTKTYHTLKDLISSKFKKDSSEMTPEELNNVAIQQHQQSYDDGSNTPYYNLMQQHIQQQQQLQHQAQQSQWNGTSNGAHQAPMWNGNRQPMRDVPVPITQQVDMNGQQVYPHMVATRASIHQHRATSQPQLNLPFKEHQPEDRRGSLANIDVTDSDEGGFASKQMWRPPNQPREPAQQILMQQQQNYLKRSSMAQQSQSQILTNGQHYQQQQQLANAFHLHPQQQQQQQQQGIPDGVYASQKVDLNRPPDLHQDWNGLQRVSQEAVRASFGHDHNQPQLSQKGEKQVPPIPPAKPPQHQAKKAPNYEHPPKLEAKKPMETSTASQKEPVPGSAASSDYDKSGNHSSNVDSGRGSAAYSSGRKATHDTSPDHSDTPVPQSRPKSNDSEWIDIVDAELRHILEPGMQNLNLRPESTISGSLSSISPPLPPLSPDGSVQNTNDTNKHTTTSSNTATNKGGSSKQSAPQVSLIKNSTRDFDLKNNFFLLFCAFSQNSKKPEYGTDSYNRPGKNKFIGPSRGLPGSILQKRGEQMRSSITKKQEQSLMKRHREFADFGSVSTVKFMKFIRF